MPFFVHRAPWWPAPTAGVSDESPRSRPAACRCPEKHRHLLLILALPFAQQAFSDAQRLGYMTKRRTGKHLVYRLAFEGFGKTSSGLGHEHSLWWTLSTLSLCPLSPGQTSALSERFGGPVEVFF